jgi:hypothetical protein
VSESGNQVLLIIRGYAFEDERIGIKDEIRLLFFGLSQYPKAGLPGWSLYSKAWGVLGTTLS